MMNRNETNVMKIEVGDLIKGFDFEPHPGRPECYVVGIVRKIEMVEPEGYFAYVIDCVFDTMPKAANVSEVVSRVGRTVFVPVQTSMDYDGRVTKV